MKRQSHCLLILLSVCEANNVIFSMTLTFVEIHLKNPAQTNDSLSDLILRLWINELQPDLIKVRINSMTNKNENWWYWCAKIDWRLYATRWVGLGLWGRCVSYVCKNCASYARQQIWYHMHAKTVFYMHIRIIYTPKSIFAYQYHKFLVLFGILFIHIFMRPGSELTAHQGRFSVNKVCFFLHTHNAIIWLQWTWNIVHRSLLTYLLNK